MDLYNVDGSSDYPNLLELVEFRPKLMAQKMSSLSEIQNHSQ